MMNAYKNLVFNRKAIIERDRIPLGDNTLILLTLETICDYLIERHEQELKDAEAESFDPRLCSDWSLSDGQ